MIKCSHRIGFLTFVTFILIWPNIGAAMSADTELFLIDDSILKGRVVPAVSEFLESSDPSAARQLVDEAIASLQFQTALKSDTIAERTTAQYLAEGSKQLLDGKLPKQLLDDGGQIIQGRDAIRRRQTETILSPFLILFLCSWSENGGQTSIDWSRSVLTDYLRRHSRWMDEMLGSSNELLWDAPNLPLPIGGEAKLLTQTDAQKLLKELQSVPPPSQDPTLANQYASLKQLLQIAAQEPRFRLLLRTT